MDRKNLNGLVFGALFTALTCVFTMVIKVPTLGTNGYVNIGDTGVLLSAWLLGGWYGVIAAGLGSGLADILSGYPAYAPGTGTPEVGGFTSFETLEFIRQLKDLNFVGFDVVEVAPPYDHSEITAYMGANIVFEFMSILAYQKKNNKR